MSTEIELRIRVRVTDWARFEEVFDTRVNTPMSGFDPLDIHMMSLPDKVFEVLIGCNPDAGPGQLGLELTGWNNSEVQP